MKRKFKRLINSLSPYSNDNEKTVQNFFTSLTEGSNQTQTINRLLELLQHNIACINLWCEFRYKGYAYLNKSTRKQLYANLGLIEDDFAKFYIKTKDNKNQNQNQLTTNSQNDSQNNSNKLLLLTCIMNYLSSSRGLYVYQESSSFGKLLQDPNKNYLIGDCNQIVTLYIYLYSRYYPISDLNLRTLPGHVALHFKGQDIEATKGIFTDYSKTKNNKLLPIHEIVSINLLDVTDIYLKTKPIDPKDLLQSSRLAYLLSNNRDIVTHNLNASYGTVISSLIKNHNFEQALIFAKQSKDTSYLKSVTQSGVVYNISKHNFAKARQLAEHIKENPELIRNIYRAEGRYYFDNENYSMAVKPFSQANDYEAVKSCYEALFIKEQNKLPKNLNSENIKNCRHIINNMNLYAKKSNNKDIQTIVKQYSKYL